MSDKTKIQWADTTSNPIMACSGCELRPSVLQIIAAIYATLRSLSCGVLSKFEIGKIFGNRLASDVYHARKTLAVRLAKEIEASEEEHFRIIKAIEQSIASQFRCYAGILHLRHGEDDTQPRKKTNPGYAKKFENVKPFPGRMAKTAHLGDLRGCLRPEKPWLDLLPRLIFISDMGDALSTGVSFDYLLQEIIETVVSTDGKRHTWLWLTKRPNKMAEFSEWLLVQGLTWPDNLVAMTSVTSQKTVNRVDQLRKVKCKLRGLSMEPLWDEVELKLDGISWVIVGGESGPYSKPFDLNWGRSILRQCRKAKTACFIKQLGANPCQGELEIGLKDSHGGDWAEWPADLRVREFPKAFYA